MKEKSLIFIFLFQMSNFVIYPYIYILKIKQNVHQTMGKTNRTYD